MVFFLFFFCSGWKIALLANAVNHYKATDGIQHCVPQKNDKNSMVLFEVPVKDLTFDQLQLLKVNIYLQLDFIVQKYIFAQIYPIKI